MLIRSQDKMELIPNKRLIILCPDKCNNNYRIVNYYAVRPIDDTICEDYDVLGEYKTKERALEILDSIQKAIIDLEDDKIWNMVNNNPENISSMKSVYEMPQE